jgi:D-serine deaminase-like pyridoxal phosphate-dependent protein
MAWVNTHALKQRLDAATSELEAPLAVVDLGAFDANRRDLARRAGGCPIRVASKSLRTRWAINEALRHTQFNGVLGYTLPEAIWLASPDHAGPGIDDILVGYPTVDKTAITELAASELLSDRITLMVDDIAQLDLIESVVRDSDRKIRVCIDVDASWRPKPPGLRTPLHVGAKRSPLHSADDVVGIVNAVLASAHLALVGLMFYEAQIAGLGNQPRGHSIRGRAITMMQSASIKELAGRRPAIVRDVAATLRSAGQPALEFVNAGGTGSLEASSADSAVTEVTAGSGFFGPTLFDNYSHFSPIPAAAFALPVVRRPGPRLVTTLGGGYLASGAADDTRLPTPWLPMGLTLDSQEGAGEVQTPLHGDVADELAIGDQVWFRHTKAGELSEHFTDLALIRGSELIDLVPTYRGEGKCFL